MPTETSPIWDVGKPWQWSLLKDNINKYSELITSKSFRLEICNRLSAILKMLSNCPDYFVLFEPLIRARATEEEIMQAKKNLIKARYPKLYREVFEDDDSSSE